MAVQFNMLIVQREEDGTQLILANRHVCFHLMIHLLRHANIGVMMK